MAVKFLLDADISPQVAKGCRTRGLDAKSVAEVMSVESSDEEILRFAVTDGRILVTYNNGDFTRLLARFVRENTPLPGVVFVSGRTIASHDFGGLVQAIVALAEAIRRGEADASGGLFLNRT